MALRWYKGNLHTHTTNSDGDSPPDDVVAWYRDAGYDFLALTDHDFLTLPADHREAAGSMELVHGEEVSAGDIHMNALGLRSTLEPVIGATSQLTLETNAGRIRDAGALASINHPNFRWALRLEDLEPLGSGFLFEVYNAGPGANNQGAGADRPSAEGLWDGLLSLGRRSVAVAVDDAHEFRTWGHGRSNPGRAWVHVCAESAAEVHILEALRAGRCYASTGVELEALDQARSMTVVSIAQVADLHYRTTFIGQGGRVLDVVDGVEPRYRCRGTEGYVRARITDSDGGSAWLQAQFLD
jgi:predicted metal-dependent phosphoesterase TrpH